VNAENNDEAELNLDVITEKHERLVNDTIDFHVTVDDEPEANVTVWFNGNEAMTDEDGNATLTFDEAGTYNVTAEKEGFVNDTYSLDVFNNALELEIEVITDEEDWIEGEEIKFHVTIDDEAVENATVWFNGNEAMTDEDGNATLTFDEAGTFTVTAEKDDEWVNDEYITYVSDTIEIEIEDEEIPGFTVIMALVAILGAVSAVLAFKYKKQNN